MKAPIPRRFAAALLAAAGSAAAPAIFAEPLAASLEPQSGYEHVRTCGGEPCDAVLRGALRFVDRRLSDLDANGRSCADCHMVTDHFQLSPAAADARFKFLEWQRSWNPRADDPLFRPVDADDFRVNGENARDFSNLRQNGLVRVTLPLPATLKLIDPATGLPSAATTVDVWRMVPSIENVALTGPDGVNPWPRGPNNTGGYQLDGRVATLQDQALGALLNHAQASDKGGCSVQLQLRKRAIAAQLGIAPETLSRVLRHLRELRLISGSGRVVDLVDPIGLRTLAGPSAPCQCGAV